MSDLTFKTGEVLGRNRAEFTIRVRLVRDWRFRVGFALIRLGGKIAGLAIRREDPPDMLRALRDCVDGWTKGDDIVGPMVRARAIIAECEGQ